MQGLGKMSKEKVCKNVPKMYFFEPKSYQKVPKVTKKVQFWTKSYTPKKSQAAAEGGSRNLYLVKHISLRRCN